MKRFHEYYPAPEELKSMHPENIAYFMLVHLCDWYKQMPQNLGRYNYLNSNQVIEYIRDSDFDVQKKLAEAWVWLESECFICPRPDQPSNDMYFVTDKGLQYSQISDFESYKKGRFLPREILDQSLVEKAYPLFLSGDYDTAIFRAFKEIEVRVRAKAKLSETMVGVVLMRTAFNQEKGLLASKDMPSAEKQAISDLFAGCMGIFKNPSSHREVKFEDAAEVCKIILFADYLLKFLDRL